MPLMMHTGTSGAWLAPGLACSPLAQPLRAGRPCGTGAAAAPRHRRVLSMLGVMPCCSPVGWCQDETMVQSGGMEQCGGHLNPTLREGLVQREVLAPGSGQEPAWLLWSSILLGMEALARLGKCRAGVASWRVSGLQEQPEHPAPSGEPGWASQGCHLLGRDPNSQEHSQAGRRAQEQDRHPWAGGVGSWSCPPGLPGPQVEPSAPGWAAALQAGQPGRVARATETRPLARRGHPSRMGWPRHGHGSAAACGCRPCMDTRHATTDPATCLPAPKNQAAAVATVQWRWLPCSSGGYRATAVAIVHQQRLSCTSSSAAWVMVQLCAFFGGHGRTQRTARQRGGDGRILTPEHSRARVRRELG